MSTQQDADAQLVAQVQQGNARAFEMLVLKYQRRIERLIGRMVRDVDLVPDIAQETFIRAYRALPNFRGESAFYTWLYRIAMNLAIDSCRKRRRRRTGSFDEAVAARDVALANYRQAVLSAYQQVEDNLVAVVQLKQQQEAQRLAWDAARRNLALTQAQYVAGTVSYLNVVTAQTAALTAERAWLDVQSRRWLATNSLMAAGLRF